MACNCEITAYCENCNTTTSHKRHIGCYWKCNVCGYPNKIRSCSMCLSANYECEMTKEMTNQVKEEQNKFING